MGSFGEYAEEGYDCRIVGKYLEGVLLREICRGRGVELEAERGRRDGLTAHEPDGHAADLGCSDNLLRARTPSQLVGGPSVSRRGERQECVHVWELPVHVSHCSVKDSMEGHQRQISRRTASRWENWCVVGSLQCREHSC